ncbi:MAG: hypothetical protein F4Y02_05245 [Chloroflexi bacterium]|nr:hypothetical protein [Chloroflexota bacterium]
MSERKPAVQRAAAALVRDGRAAADRMRQRMDWALDDAIAQPNTTFGHVRWHAAQNALEALRAICVFLNDTDDGKYEGWFGDQADEMRERLRG